MHEHRIANEIIDKAKSYGVVRKIVVHCGELANLPAKDLKNVLEDYADFDVDVFETDAKVRCSCGFVGRPKIEMHSHDVVVFFCPKCGKVPQVLSGDDIVLKTVEVDD